MSRAKSWSKDHNSPREKQDFDRSLAHAKRSQSSSPADALKARPINSNSQLERRHLLNEIIAAANPEQSPMKPSDAMAESEEPEPPQSSSDSSEERALQQEELHKMADAAKKFCEMEKVAAAAERTVCYENFSPSGASACHMMREERKKRRVARNCEEEDEIDACEDRALELLTQRKFFFPNRVSQSDLQEFHFPIEAPRYARNDNVDVFDDAKWWESRVEHRRPMTYAEVIVREHDGTPLEKEGGGPWIYYVALLEIQKKKSYDHIAYGEHELRISGPQKRQRLTDLHKDRNLQTACRSESVIQFKGVLWAIAQNDPRWGRMQLVRRGEDWQWTEVVIQYEAVERVMNIKIGDEERPCDQAGVSHSELKDMDLTRKNLEVAELAHPEVVYSPDRVADLLGIKRRRGEKRCHDAVSVENVRKTRSNTSKSASSISGAHSPPPPEAGTEPSVKLPGKKGLMGKSQKNQSRRRKDPLALSLRKKIHTLEMGRKRGNQGRKTKGKVDFTIPNLARSTSEADELHSQPAELMELVPEDADLRDGSEKQQDRPLSSCDIVDGDLAEDRKVTHTDAAVAEMNKAVTEKPIGKTEQQSARKAEIMAKLEAMRQNVLTKNTAKAGRAAAKIAALAKNATGGKKARPAANAAIKKALNKQAAREKAAKKNEGRESRAVKRQLYSRNTQEEMSNESEEEEVVDKRSGQGRGLHNHQEWELPLPKSFQEKDDAHNATPISEISEVMPINPKLDFCWDRRALNEISKTLGGIYTHSADTTRRMANLERKVGTTDLVKLAAEVDKLSQWVRKTDGNMTKMQSVQQSTLTAILNVSDSLSSGSTKSPDSAERESVPFTHNMSPSEIARLQKTPSIHFSPEMAKAAAEKPRTSLLARAEIALKKTPPVMKKTPETGGGEKEKPGIRPLIQDRTPLGAAGGEKEKAGGSSKRKSSEKSDAAGRQEASGGKKEASGGKKEASGGRSRPGGGSSDDDENDDDDDKNNRRKKGDEAAVPASKPDSDGEEVPDTDNENGKGSDSGERSDDTDTADLKSDPLPLTSAAAKKESSSDTSSDEEIKKLQKQLETKQLRLKTVQERTSALEQRQIDEEKERRLRKDFRKQKKMEELRAASRKVERELAVASRKERDLSSSIHSTDTDEKGQKRKEKDKGAMGKKRRRTPDPPHPIPATTPGRKRSRFVSNNSADEGQDDGAFSKASAGVLPPLPPRECHALSDDITHVDNELGFWVKVDAETKEKTVPFTVQQMSDWSDQHYQAAIGHCRPTAQMQTRQDMNAFQVAARIGTEHSAEVSIVTGIKNELPFYAGGFERLEEVNLRDPIRYVSQQRWERVQKQKIPEVNKAKNPGGQAYILFRTMLQEDPNWQELLLIDENHVKWSRKHNCFADVFSFQPRVFSEFFRLFALGAFSLKHLELPFSDSPVKTKKWCKDFAQVWNKYRLNDKGVILKRYGLQKLAPAEQRAKERKQHEEKGESDKGETDSESDETSPDEEYSSEDSSDTEAGPSKKVKKVVKKTKVPAAPKSEKKVEKKEEKKEVAAKPGGKVKKEGKKEPSSGSKKEPSGGSKKEPSGGSKKEPSGGSKKEPSGGSKKETPGGSKKEPGKAAAVKKR